MFSCRCSPSCFPDKTEFQNHIGAKRQKMQKQKKVIKVLGTGYCARTTTPLKKGQKMQKKRGFLPFQVQVQVQVKLKFKSLVTSD